MFYHYCTVVIVFVGSQVMVSGREGPGFGRAGKFGGRGPFNSEPIKPNKALGSSCTDSAECLTAYAFCEEKTCRCRSGFQPDAESRCAPKEISCPFGAPLRSNGDQPTVCTISGSNGNFGPFSGRAKINDSCPEGYFCLTYNARFQESQEGHCCPKPEPKCPVGEPDTKYSCGSPFSLAFNIGPQFQTGRETRCPFQTHYCANMGASGNPFSRGSAVCCPKPCPVGTILKDGVCYGSSRLGEDCQVDEQCSRTRGSCQDGKCSCTEDQIPNRQNKHCMVPFCPSRTPSKRELALRNENGTFKSCQGEDKCGDGGICMQNSYCCPEPEPTCPGDPETVLDSPTFCSPFRFQPRRQTLDGSNEERCPQGQFCYNYMFGRQRKGVCCSQRSRFPLYDRFDFSGPNIRGFNFNRNPFRSDGFRPINRPNFT